MTIAKSFRLIVFTTTLLLLHQFADCQLLFAKNHKRYVIKTVNVEDGLINNSVNDIVTDTFGFTWIATKTGLQRYNGYRLETVHPTIKGKLVNISYQVHFLKTKEGLLWVTYRNGILLYNPYLDGFRSLITLPSTTSDCPLRPLEETQQGVWCLNENGFVLYNTTGRLVKEIPVTDSLLIPTFLNPKFQLAVNAKSIFLLTVQNGILRFDKATGLIQVLYLERESINSLACSESKLYIMHSRGIAVVDIDDKNELNSREAFHTDKFSSGTIKVFGNQVLASVNQHLLLLDSNCNNVSEISTLGSMPVLPAGYISTMYEDQFQRLWLLTNDDIKIVQNYTIPFQYYAYPAATNFIKCICVDESNNRVLAGCFAGGIQLYDTLNNPLWKSPLLIPKTKDIVCMEKLDNNTYFVETLGQGWYILFLHEKRLEPLQISNEDEAQLHTHNTAFPNNIQRLDSTNIILTTNTDVIQCCFKNNKIASYQILFHNSSNHLINCFYLAQNNHCLWVGSNSGILYCKHSSGSIDTLTVPDGYQVRSIICDAQNNTWVGTDKGLFVYANRELIKVFTTSNGLLNDCIYSMLADDKQKTIYASSNLGLSALQLNGVLRNYTKEKGLQENEFNTSAIARSSKGKLFFGGVNGITAFYPSNVITEPDHPSLLIYKTEINDQPFALHSATWNADTYSLSYNQNKIDFSLTAFGLQAASGYVYEYKMQGFDKYWTSTNNPTNISYHLPPGKYQFEAKLAQFPSTFITRNIIIEAPFWQRWWFYFACVVFVFALLLLTARAVYRRRYVARLQALRIRQQVLAERERISRDLHDNIGAYASAISASVDDVIYQFNASDHIALKRLKDSAREIIIQLRDSIWALNKESQTVIMLSDRIKNYIQKLQPNYPNIDFDVDENIEQNQTIASITALHLLRIVQEAVHNAVKHSGCSSIRITIHSQSPIVISVKDNGRGMPGQPQMGEGLKNMQSRAADIGWHLSLANRGEGCCIQLRNTK